MSAELGNKYALGLTTTGKPPIFSNNEELERKCIDYFEYCKENNEKVNITGLALYLGFCSRQSIYDYKKIQEYSYTIKRACLAVENSYENGGTAFDIFALKNMGWEDKQSFDHGSKDGSMSPAQLTPEVAKAISDKLNDEV